MTLEEVNSKIKYFNEGLERFISESQLYDTFDSAKLTTMSTAIDRIILQDPVVRNILENGTVQDRIQYTDAIKMGIQRARELIKDYGKTEKDDTRKSAIDGISNDSNMKTTKTIEGIERIDNDDKTVVYSDIERRNNLTEKITKAEAAINIAGKFEKIKESLKSEGKTGTVEEAIENSEKVLEAYEKFVENDKFIADASRDIKLPVLLKKYNTMTKNPLFDITDGNAQDMLKEIKKAAKLLTHIDNLDSHNASLDLIRSMPGDLTDEVKVATWISELTSKASDPNMSKKLNPSNPEYKVFFESRKEFIRKEMVSILKNSPVYKNIDVDYEKILKPDFDIRTFRTFLKAKGEELNSYKFIEGKDIADVERYIADAKRLRDSIDLTAKSVSQISFNGYEQNFEEIDMTDVDQVKDAMAYLRSLPNDNPFKQEVKKEAMALAGTRPTNRWYHKVLNVVTFGRYMTPEQKYENNLVKKDKEVLTKLVEKNKQEREDAQENVNRDKDLYKKKARKVVMEDPNKKFDREKVQKQREAEDSFSR